MMIRVCGILCCAWLLTACGARDLRISTAPVQLSVAPAADPAGVQMLPVQLRVINKDNLNSYVADLAQQQSSDNPVFIAMTTQDYENLALNIADLRRYIMQQRSVIQYYRSSARAP